MKFTRNRKEGLQGMSAVIDSQTSSMNTREVIDRILKDPGTQYELTEFENLGKPIHEILSIYPRTATTGCDAGKTKYFLKSFVPFSSGSEEKKGQFFTPRHVEKYQRGSSGQLELYPFDVREFRIWNAPQSVQQEIRHLYDKATESPKQSRDLLEQARARVEHLIEEAARA